MKRIFMPKLRPGKMAWKNRTFRLFSVGGLLLLSLTFVSAAMAHEYDASDAGTKPKIIRQIPVKYPTLAERNGVEGRVVVRLLIGINGKAEKIKIVESTPKGIFNENTLNSLKYWQFEPSTKNGELVAAWVKIPLRFKLD